MKLGVVFPQTEIGSDPAVVRDYAQAAESAGYDHRLVFDHVLGGKLERFDKLGRLPPYTDDTGVAVRVDDTITIMTARQLAGICASLRSVSDNLGDTNSSPSRNRGRPYGRD